jgi:hypothetical protein
MRQVTPLRMTGGGWDGARVAGAHRRPPKLLAGRLPMAGKLGVKGEPHQMSKEKESVRKTGHYKGGPPIAGTAVLCPYNGNGEPAAGKLGVKGEPHKWAKKKNRSGRPATTNASSAEAQGRAR